MGHASHPLQGLLRMRKLQGQLVNHLQLYNLQRLRLREVLQGRIRGKADLMHSKQLLHGNLQQDNLQCVRAELMIRVA